MSRVMSVSVVPLLDPSAVMTILAVGEIEALLLTAVWVLGTCNFDALRQL